MASRFQNRLVGTIILVSIGVIILPDVLDGKKTHYQEEVASIPLKPQMDESEETYEIVPPQELNAELPASPTNDEKSPVTEKPIQKVSEGKEDKPEVTSDSTQQISEYQDSAWIIQLMALKNTNNAKKLVSDLQKRGYQAHTKAESGFTRVIIGPDVSKSKLERQLSELEKITGAKGQLIKFRPLNP